MRALSAIFLATLVASGVVEARSPCPADVTEGMSYHLARGKLIEAGFAPVDAPSTNRDPNSPFLRLGYIELFDTAMTTPESSPMFLWSSVNGKFMVETKGNEDPKVVSCDPY